jgi:hypothetical protein
MPLLAFALIVTALIDLSVVRVCVTHEQSAVTTLLHLFNLPSQ